MTDEYETIRTNVPPVLSIQDGELVVQLIVGKLTVVAGVGDGSWFFSRVVALLVDPALKSYHTARVLDAHAGRATVMGESWIRTTAEGVELVDPEVVYKMTETGFDPNVGRFYSQTEGEERVYDDIASPND